MNKRNNKPEKSFGEDEDGGAIVAYNKDSLFQKLPVE